MLMQGPAFADGCHSIRFERYASLNPAHAVLTKGTACPSDHYPIRGEHNWEGMKVDSPYKSHNLSLRTYNDSRVVIFWIVDCFYIKSFANK